MNPGATPPSAHDTELVPDDLLTPLQLRGVVLRNRIGMSPMCQYSAREGFADDWHLVHLGSRAAGGAGLVMVEATAVAPEGRISPGDLGIWDEAHVEALARIARFVRAQGAVAAIQLAHAGRKGSCDLPWQGGRRLAPAQGGWEVVAPSALPFHAEDPAPVALDDRGIEAVIAAFEGAARRAVAAGFQLIEIHAAHGYLLHQFLSPLSNRRADTWGGPLENRMRLALAVAERVRAALPPETALCLRLSATDWVEGGWDLPQSIELSRRLRALGVDLIDVSSGGLVPAAIIPVAHNYQVPFAAAIRRDAGIATAAVGLITDPVQANDIVTGGSADLVLLGRELLREPYWPLKAEQALEAEPDWPLQYGYALKRRGK